jgi:hypothetical protein
LRRFLEHEQHAFKLRHLGTEHQTDLALLGCQRKLCVDLVHAGAQLDAREVQLRLLLRLGQRGKGQQTKAKQESYSHGCIVPTNDKCPRLRASS